MTITASTLSLTEQQLEHMLDVIEAADLALLQPTPTTVQQFEQALQECDDITFSLVAGTN